MIILIIIKDIYAASLTNSTRKIIPCDLSAADMKFRILHISNTIYASPS